MARIKRVLDRARKEIAKRRTETYAEHYARSRAAFGGAPLRDLYDLTFEVVRPGEPHELLQLAPGHDRNVEACAVEFDALIANPANVHQIAIAEDEDFAVRLGPCLKLTSLEAIAQEILPQLEQRLFGSNIIVEGCYCYRSLPRTAPLRSSWIWHFDNNPREIVKIMIFLTDVTDHHGPMVVLRHQGTGAGLKMETTKCDIRQWAAHSSDSRLSDSEIEALLHDSYELHPLTGPPGTLVVFDNNIVHRATVPTTGRRDVVVLMVRPWPEPVRPYVNPRMTGSFGEPSIFRDPTQTVRSA